MEDDFDVKWRDIKTDPPQDKDIILYTTEDKGFETFVGRYSAKGNPMPSLNYQYNWDEFKYWALLDRPKKDKS